MFMLAACSLLHTNPGTAMLQLACPMSCNNSSLLNAYLLYTDAYNIIAAGMPCEPCDSMSVECSLVWTGHHTIVLQLA